MPFVHHHAIEHVESEELLVLLALVGPLVTERQILLLLLVYVSPVDLAHHRLHVVLVFGAHFLLIKLQTFVHIPFENLLQLVVPLLLRRQNKLPTIHAEHVHTSLEDTRLHAALKRVPGTEDTIVVVEAFTLGLRGGRRLAELQHLEADRALQEASAQVARRGRLHLREVIHAVAAVKRYYLLVGAEAALHFAALKTEI